jgi:hypothetical protein
MERKFQKKTTYAYAFIIGTLIFIIGFLIANQIIIERNVNFLRSNVDNSYAIFKESIQLELFGQNLCNETFLRRISNELDYQRATLNSLEKNFGKLDERTLLQKRVYSIAELEHLTIVLKKASWCGSRSDILLFFYSNSEENIKDSERVGEMITVLQERRPFAYVYSFDSDLDEELIGRLLAMYNITSSPAVIINNERVVNPTNIDELYALLPV